MAKKQRNKRAARKLSCPECGSVNIVPVLQGPITPALQRLIEAGQAVGADREEWEGMTEWYCKQCGCDWSGKWKRFKRPATFRQVR